MFDVENMRDLHQDNRMRQFDFPCRNFLINNTIILYSSSHVLCSSCDREVSKHCVSCTIKLTVNVSTCHSVTCHVDLKSAYLSAHGLVVWFIVGWQNRLSSEFDMLPNYSHTKWVLSSKLFWSNLIGPKYFSVPHIFQFR